MSEEYEWAVVHTRTWSPDMAEWELHRGPMTEEKARGWVLKAIASGISSSVFMVVRRPIGKWEVA